MSESGRPKRIFHIALAHEWSKALENGAYTTGSLETEGFIHFSTGRQLLRTANKFYRGNRDVVLLSIDPKRLAAELRYEPIEDGQEFPHLYGQLNLDAVTAVLIFAPESDGSFVWPAGLAKHEDEL
ncbi:MAG: DUF952 domain-containing protein [Chloroflexi bacterium]|nr:MAG: DUF952 domain-containing protein [Chloroflexota bacterium]